LADAPAIKTTAPMPAPPVRQFSFTDWQVNNPTAPPPGDRLDAEFDRANSSITDTITWASTSLNTDGSLRDGSVGQNTLQPDLFDFIANDAINQVQPLVDQAQAFSNASQTSANTSSDAANTATAQATVASGAASTAQDAAASAATARDLAAALLNQPRYEDRRFFEDALTGGTFDAGALDDPPAIDGHSRRGQRGYLGTARPPIAGPGRS